MRLKWLWNETKEACSKMLGNEAGWAWESDYRRVRIKRPGFGDNRMPLNRGVGARCVLRLLRHVVSAHPFSTV